MSVQSYKYVDMFAEIGFVYKSAMDMQIVACDDPCDPLNNGGLKSVPTKHYLTATHTDKLTGLTTEFAITYSVLIGTDLQQIVIDKVQAIEDLYSMAKTWHDRKQSSSTNPHTHTQPTSSAARDTPDA